MKFLKKIKESHKFPHIDKIKIFIYFLFIILGVLISSISYTIVTYYENQNTLKETESHNRKIIAQQKALKEKQEIEEMIIKQYFGNLNLLAENIVIKNLSSGKTIYSKNQDKKVGLASLTKIATAIVALENKKDTTEIKAPFLLASDDNGLVAGEIFNTEKLLEFMFIVSSNDAATAISYGGELKEENHKDFLKQMNNLADDLGMKSTIFFSDSGLDINESINGSYGSAGDMSILVNYIYKNYPKFVKNITTPSKEVCSTTICHNIENTNPLLFNHPGIVFSKTGWTKQARGNLALIYKIDNEKYSIVILGSTKQGRFDDAENIFQALESYSIQKNKN